MRTTHADEHLDDVLLVATREGCRWRGHHVWSWGYHAARRDTHV